MNPISNIDISMNSEPEVFTLEALFYEIEGLPVKEAKCRVIARRNEVISLLQEYEEDKEVCDFKIEVDGSAMVLWPIYGSEKETYEKEKER